MNERPLSPAALALLEYIRRNPGLSSPALVSGLGMPRYSLDHHKRNLRNLGLVAAIPPSGAAARWHPAGPHLAAMWEKQRADGLERDRARNRENGRRAADLKRGDCVLRDDWAEAPIIKRTVPASQCQPIRPRAPASVFHLAAL